MGNKREWPGVRAGSKSTIEIDFYYRDVRCKERLKLQPSPANLKRAFNHRAAILDTIERGTFDYATTFPDSKNRLLFAKYKGEGYSLKDYLDSWLISQEKHVKSSTYNGYKKIVNNTLIPEFGTLMLSELRRPHVKEWGNKQTAGNKRLANVQSVLRIALQDAMSDDLIESNQLHGWTFERKEAPKQTHVIDPFNEADRELILQSCRDIQHKNLFQFAFWTGLRTSELVALCWGDIDWVNKTIHVWRARTQAADEPEEPKTSSGNRFVKLLTPALDALIAQKEHSFLADKEIFLNPLHGKPWEGDAPIRKQAWLPALKKAGLRYRNPYQTRHTFASMTLTAGESPIWLSQQMGHSDTSMIFRNYGRWIETENAKSGEKTVAMFSTTDGGSIPVVNK
jgi:integrase